MTTTERMNLVRAWQSVPLDDLHSAVEALVDTWRHVRRTCRSDAIIETASEALSTFLELWRERTDSRHFISTDYQILIDEGPEPKFALMPVWALPKPSVN